MEGKAPAFLGIFFGLAAVVCWVASTTLFRPGSGLRQIWAIKPDGFQQMLALGWPAAWGMLALGGVMAVTCYGAVRRRSWGWKLALAIFIANGLSDLGRVFLGNPAEGMVGVVVVSLILWWMTRKRIRGQFQ